MTLHTAYDRQAPANHEVAGWSRVRAPIGPADQMSPLSVAVPCVPGLRLGASIAGTRQNRMRGSVSDGYLILATLLPAELPTDVPWSERRVHEALSALPDSWTVMWDVPVGMFGKATARLRQIDILLLHKRFGIIVLEVKGGEIRTEKGDWFTRPANSPEWARLARSPFVQAADQRYQLQRFLAQQLRIDSRCLAHGVAFPGCRVESDLGPDAPRPIILDAHDLDAPVEALRRLAEHWAVNATLTDDQLDRVIAALRPTFELTVLTATQIADTTRLLDRETRQQVQMVENQVEGYRELLHLDRAIVLGGAGTGKTVLAVERAKQLVRTGSRPLMLCHRSGVRAFISTLLGLKTNERGFDVSGTHELQVAGWSDLLEAGGIRKFADGSGELSGLAERFLALRDSLPEPFGALVVDEGQEFTAAQFDALSWLIDDPETSPIYVFADPFQHSGILHVGNPHERRAARGRFEWKAPIDAPTVLLTTNCRNSRPIADFATSFYPESPPTALIDGTPPVIQSVGNESELVRLVLTTARDLCKEQGLRPNQLLIVLVGVPVKDAVRRAGACGVHLLPATQVYRFPLTPKDVRIVIGTPDTVQGLEAEVCLVAYRHGAPDSAVLRDLYVSASRARSHLTVVTDATRDEIRNLTQAVAAARSRAESDGDSTAESGRLGGES